MRKEVEDKVIRALLTEAIAAGYLITVNNGEDIPVRKSNDIDEITKGMYATDEEHLHFNKEDGSNHGWVFLVYGNDGYDVINDYTTNLEHVMTEANKVSDHYSN